MDLAPGAGLTRESFGRRMLFVTGTRADFSKLKPLIREVAARPDFTYQIFATGMHMLARRHCVGGLSIIELSDATTEELTLTRELDTVIVEDAAVRHEVTPIRAAARAREGIRDMLLVDLNPYSG